MFAPAVSRFVVSSSALVFALLTLSAPARAEDSDALIKQGVELRRLKRDREALEQFRRAYDLESSPRAIAQMGLAEFALHRWVDAEAHVVRALAAGQDPWIVKYQPTLESARAKIAEHLGSLDVTGRPDGAELRIDGQPVGSLPLPAPLRVATGRIVVEVSASGYLPATRTVDVLIGQVSHEQIVLQTAAPGDAGVAGPAQPRDDAPRVVLADGPRPEGHAD
jgi:PEGA domain